MRQHALKWQGSIPRARDTQRAKALTHQVIEKARDHLVITAGPSAREVRFRHEVRQRTGPRMKVPFIDIMVVMEYDGPISPAVAPLKVHFDMKKPGIPGAIIPGQKPGQLIIPGRR